MTTTKESKQGTTGNGRAWERKLAIYHPNGAGNGAAMQLEPRVNRVEADRYNCFFLEMAAQKTTARREEGKGHATFDWEHKLTVKLDFTDICELLAVLEGRMEKAGGTRNGLFHDSEQASTVISLQKSAERPGYFLGLSRKNKTGGEPMRVRMMLSETEAIGLRCVFQSSLFFLTFHTHLFAGPRARAQREVEADQ